MPSHQLVQQVLAAKISEIKPAVARNPAALVIARLVVVAAGGSGVETVVACFILPVRGVV